MNNTKEKPKYVDEEEVKAVEEVIKPLLEGSKPIGICLYGSRVAGYAKPDSDYDVLVVLEHYKPAVRYKYLQDGVTVSSLLVDANALLEDAARAKLGEFVVGRLLNIYDPIYGAEYLKNVEVTYKKRVILETLRELALTYGELSTILLIKPEYFLFHKLKKRAAIYPPAFYSYIKTYGGPYASRNIEATLKGFKEALKDIEEEGLINLIDDGARVKRSGIRVNQMTKILDLLTYASRGITQYAVHSYAGRVGLDVVGKEIFSKLSRSRSVSEMPEILEQPTKALSISEGRLVVECDDWVKDAKQHFGFDPSAETKFKGLGEFYSTTQLLEITNGKRSQKVVVKRFKNISAFKWTLLNIWAIPSKKFEQNPDARMAYEYLALLKFRDLGFNTPQILLLYLSDRILVTEFLQGKNLGDIITHYLAGESEDLEPVKIYGRILAELHKKGYTIGDTKPSNTLYIDSKLYLTDLEQAMEGGDPSWDIAEFIYYAIRLTPYSNRVKNFINTFKEGYLSIGEKSALAEAASPKYLKPFQPIILPNVVKIVREELACK
jgi:tRNA A-37 threonylcarbamoyl transferase component Bud32/predicted nucleotidyltransferase